MESFAQLGKKKLTLEDITAYVHPTDYQALVNCVMQAVAEGQLKPVKSSRSNGKRPPLAQQYWVITQETQNEDFLQELQYQLHPALQNDYYITHLPQYAEDRAYVLALNQFWKNQKKLLEDMVSVNERSFQIWGQEKFLKEGAGPRILKHVGLSMDALHVYQTAEPLAYYVHHKQTPQNILIVENKDTFFSMRRHLLEGADTILGLAIGTLIYGGGKKIQKSMADFLLCAEPYLVMAENQFYYAGDLDYEGIAIFQGLQHAVSEAFTIHAFVEAYRRMLQKAEQIGCLPLTKEGQKEGNIEPFLALFTIKERSQLSQLLAERRYIPQEILTRLDF